MDGWVEYFQELYSRENIVTDAAVEGTVNLPIRVELDIPLSVEELSKAIDSLDYRKAPGKDGIPSKVIKAGEKSSSLLLPAPAATAALGKRDPNIITLYEN